jgi:hypothetical protein
LITGDKLPSPGPKLKLNIVPKHARVDDGGSVEFEAKLTGLKGQYPALEWRANPTDLGDFPEGTTGYTALFTANDGGQGRVLVTVSLNTETEIAMGWATVDIGGPGEFPSKVKVSVEPEECSMVIGDKPFTFTANGVPTEQTAQLTWSVAPKRLGTIDDAGNFTPTAPGWGLIITKLDTEKGIAVGKAKVYVGTAGSLPVVITIEPLTAETSVNGGVTFEARVTDMQDNLVTDTPIQWKAVPGSLGTISETGVFSAGSKPGHVLITAKVVGPKGSATAQARVTINSSVATGFATGTGKLQVTVSGPESVSVNGTYTYIAFVEDVVDPGELEFKWRVASPSIGKVTAGEPGTATFTPRKAGRCVIIVDVKGPQGTGTGRISITVNE